MLTRPIPSTGEAIPVIGLGTWQTFDVGGSRSAREPLANVLSAFVDGGGRVVDSSPMYGRAEAVVGELATSLGIADRLFLATKVWTRGRAAGIAEMQASIEKMGGRVDLLQIHNLVDAETHLSTLAAWKREGRIRYLGVTHYTASAYAALEPFVERGGIDFVQLNYSVAEREAERRLLPLAANRGIAVLANRPFGSGSVFRSLRGKPLPDFAKELQCATWSELLLKFVVAHPAITCAIPATSDLEHLRANLRAGEGPMPDEALRARIVREAGFA
ncbi:MAG: aldo/keto reductase [Acidobacteria bacterium]|nr:aldo/keto reductase [Acidobacteriota bacterium]MBV9476355.1 aldo/keto reductase [Acidobacteriota bacterium]